MRTLSFKQNYSKIMLSKPLKVNIIKRDYPGHAKSILNLISKGMPKTSNTALIPMREINICNAIKNKLIREKMLNRPQNIIFVKKELYKTSTTASLTGANVSDSKKKALLYLPAPEKSSVLYLPASKDFSKPKGYSGLIDLYNDFETFNFATKKMYKHTTIVSFLQILFNFGKYKMYTPENLLKYSYKFFESTSAILFDEITQKLYRDYISSKRMGMLQHLLISIYRDKKFDKQLFIKVFGVDVNMLSVVTYLNIIETVVFKGTLGSFEDIMNYISFMAIDPDSPLLNEKASIAGYNRIHSKEQAGQMHADWLGTRAIVDDKGIIELFVMYKDTKMFESSMDQGRLHLKPELIYNVRSLREYVNKYSTGLDALKSKLKNNLENSQEIDKLFSSLSIKLQELKKILGKMPKKSTGAVDDVGNIKIIDQWISEFNMIIRQAMKTPEIASKINFGLSADPGRAEEFIDFYQKFFENISNKLADEMSDEAVSEIFNSKMSPKNIHFFYTTLHKYLEYFPTNSLESRLLIENAKRAIEYAFGQG